MGSMAGAAAPPVLEMRDVAITLRAGDGRPAIVDGVDLTIMPGVPEKATHDYIRHGTTTLFAALEVATGRVEQASADPARRRGDQVTARTFRSSSISSRE